MTSDPIAIENSFQEDIRTMEKNRIGNCIIGKTAAAWENPALQAETQELVPLC